MAAAGLGDGDHQLGPLATRVTDGVARLVDGESIAGGTSRLLDVVRRQVTAGLRPGRGGRERVAAGRPTLLGVGTEVGAHRARAARRPRRRRPGLAAPAGDAGRGRGCRDPHRHLQPRARRHLRRRPAAARGGAPGERGVRATRRQGRQRRAGAAPARGSRCAPWAWPTRASAARLAALGVPASFVEAMPRGAPDRRRARTRRPRRCGSGATRSRPTPWTGWSAPSPSTCVDGRGHWSCPAACRPAYRRPAAPARAPGRGGVGARSSSTSTTSPSPQRSHGGGAVLTSQRRRARPGCSAPSTTLWRRSDPSRPGPERPSCSPSASAACWRHRRHDLLAGVAPPAGPRQPDRRRRRRRPRASPGAWPAPGRGRTSLRDAVAPGRGRGRGADRRRGRPRGVRVPPGRRCSSRSSTRPRSRGRPCPSPRCPSCCPPRPRDRRALLGA